MRVKVPTNADALIALAKAISTKHTSLGATSPLSSIPGIANLGTQTTTADNNNIAAKALAKQAETATQARDVALGQSGQLTPGTVRFFVASARDILAASTRATKRNWAIGASRWTTPPPRPKRRSRS